MTSTELARIPKHSNQNLKQELKLNLKNQSQPRENHWLPWHENISHHIKQNFFILWITIWWSHQMVLPKTKQQMFTWITIHQTFSIRETWRRHSPSTSKLVVCHLYSFWQPLSKNKGLPTDKYLKSAYYDWSTFSLAPCTHTKVTTANYNYQALSISLWFHLAKDATIH